MSSPKFYGEYLLSDKMAKRIGLDPKDGIEQQSAIPRVMVFIYQPELTHSMWVDLSHRYRTLSGLMRHLKRAVKRGDYIGYRLITVHKEVMGVE